MKKTGFLKFAVVCALALICSISINAQTKAPGNLLDKSDFETEIDGKPVSLYTITNGRITAQVTNLAGYIVGIYTPDRSGYYTNVVGHNDNIQQYQGFSRNPVGAALGRYANRIGNASFTIDGVKYNVTKNNGEHTLHGGSKGFDHTVWDVEEVTERSVVMSCVLEDGTDGFPGTLKTYLTFSITDDDGVSINYKATTDKPTVCNLSHHVYFNLNGFPAENVLDHVMCINANSVTEVDSGLIPTGKLIPVGGTAFDFRNPVLLANRQVSSPAGRGGFGPGAPAPAPVPEGMVRSYDQNFCLNHTKAGALEQVAYVYAPNSGRLMEVLSDQPGLQFFTGNRVAFAMESQLYPDTPNHPEFPGNATLRPGETYSHTVIYRFPGFPNSSSAAPAAGTKKVSILGDSYSTYQGIIPSSYATFYPNNDNDVKRVEQTWWDLFIKAKGYQLEKNDSWGGTTICGTGYGGRDASASAFTTRIDLLGNPDIIFIFGGTNDAWANSPVGEYKYSNWTEEDCKYFRPALAFLLDSLKKRYPNAEIYSILNSELREEINESSREVCRHYNIPLVELHDIEKQNGHPSISGMKSICEQLMAVTK